MSDDEHRSVPYDWTVVPVGDAPIPPGPITATVPGCVHLDLMTAGLIPDPYLADHEPDVAWIARTDWMYAGQVQAPTSGPGWRVDLVAHGLDTIATVGLNGVELARTRNMHRSYRIPVGEALRDGANDLKVSFAAPLTWAEEESRRLGPRPHVNPHPFNAIRKHASSFGWDWGPDLASSGIWRPIFLEAWRTARIAAVRPLVDVEGTTGRLSAHIALERLAEQDLDVEVEVAGVRVRRTVSAGATETVVDVAVPDVRRWRPVGLGAPNCYDVSVRLLDGETGLDSWTGKVGFRTVRVDTAPDELGTPFRLIVNDVPVFVRGMNWIPDDCFPSRVDAQRYRTRLEQARDANVNLLRVWGGGIYESDDFYAACDELGLMVWQDFLFACAAYAEEEPMRSEVEAEAREAITRLSPHPSLVIWNGCNENLWGFADWDWQEPLAGRTWGAGYYRRLLPDLLAELDPSRPYTPGSPFSVDPAHHPNDPADATVHDWEVWNELDATQYRRQVPRFVAEFGYQGPPTWRTLTRSVPAGSLTPNSPVMLLHQKAEDGNGKLERGLRGHLPTPTDFGDWHWAMSLQQARAVRLGVEHYRSWSPTCAGAVVWQLNDCWPVVSWSAVDGDGRRKPLWYAVRAAFRPRLLTVQPRDGGLALVAVNDGPDRWRTEVAVRRSTFDGARLSVETHPIDLAAGAAATLELSADVGKPHDAAREVLIATTGKETTWWPFAEDVDSALPPADLDCAVDPVDGGYTVRVTARSYVRDLALLADRLAEDAEVDDLLVSLLPGESTTFTVRTTADLSAGDLTDPSVLRSANQLISPA